MTTEGNLYNEIISTYLQTNSVLEVVKRLNTNTIKVRRVLITEGLWESETSRQVGTLYLEGKTVREIAERLCMSEKNVQSYMPYTRGTYGGLKSNDAERSEDYRERMKLAAEHQASAQEVSGDNDGPIMSVKPIQNTKPEKDKQILKEKVGLHSEGFITDRLPSVMKLRFEIIPPLPVDKGKYGMEQEEENVFLANAKAENGIIRDVLVRGEMTLHALHYMIQRLFGWQNSHLHHFSLSEEEFDMITNGQKMREYMKLCGSLFLFPGAEMEDRFWDDDYAGGISIKSWLRSKYVYGIKDYSVENAYPRNVERMDEFKREHGGIMVNPNTSIRRITEKGLFEDDENTLIEGLQVRRLFKTAYPYDLGKSDVSWPAMLELSMSTRKEKYEEYQKQHPKEYGNMLMYMQELLNLRKNILAIKRAIRYGKAAEVQRLYRRNPYEVIEEQQKIVQELEELLEPNLSQGNPGVFPFADELYYSYDYGDDWRVKITCLDAYIANDNYDIGYTESFRNEEGGIELPDRIPADKLQYTDWCGNIVNDDLRQKLQTVYINCIPVCVMADGLNVMDDVGGLYGFQEFLQTLNSDDPEEQEEKADMKTWARGRGWTGRRIKPENIL